MFVAEIGLNHKGDEATAFRMLNRMVNTDLDAITFQIPQPAFYEQVKHWGGPLSKEYYEKAIDTVHKSKKLVGFAIVDKNMISFLDRCGADFWKSLSTSISDDNLQAKLKKTGKLVFVSTGISDEEEILNASKKLGNIKLIHTQLSPNVEDANLKVISRLRNLTGMEVAFGLHCSDLDVLYLSVAFNPSDYFFYVKENLHEDYPDNKHAILVDRVDEVVRKLKDLEKALGSGVKEKQENRL